MTTEPSGPHASDDGLKEITAAFRQELMALTGIAGGAAVMLGALIEIGQALHAYGSEMAPIVQPLSQEKRGDDSFVWQVSHPGRSEANSPAPHAGRHAASSAWHSYQVSDRRTDAQPQPARPRLGPVATAGLPMRASAPSMDFRLAPGAPEIVTPIHDAASSRISPAEVPEAMTSLVASYPASPPAQQAFTAEQSSQEASTPTSQPFLAPKQPVVSYDGFAARPQPDVVLRTLPQSADGREPIASPVSLPLRQPADETEQSVRPFAAQPDRQAAESGASGAMQGTIYIDASQLGRWVVDYLSREAARPTTGLTGIDPRITPTFPGAPNGA